MMDDRFFIDPFPNATSKLEDARIIFDRLSGAKNGISFKSDFNSFLTAARAVVNAMLAHGKEISGFTEWMDGELKIMSEDELLSFMYEARGSDFHEGKHELVFKTEGGWDPGSIKKPDDVGGILVTPEGLFWVVNQGTAYERRVPLDEGSSYTTVARFKNGPKTHLGKRLDSADPLTICRITLDYCAELLHRAKIEFTEDRKTPPLHS